VDAEEENQETVDAFFKSAQEDFNEKERLKRALYASRKKSTAISSDSSVDKVMPNDSSLAEPKASNISVLNNW
jgi:hypothetical protein